MNDNIGKWMERLPWLAAIVAAAALGYWLKPTGTAGLTTRIPGADRAGGTNAVATGGVNPALSGKVIRGEGQPTDLPGSWPGFRGLKRDAISAESVPLAKSWGGSGPKELWNIEVGEGFAGPIISKGRVYLMDYDREKKQDALRCFSLADGREIWRFAYPMTVKRNHGMSRTIPALNDKYLVAMGPKGHVICLDPLTGELKWSLDLARQFDATIPPWYAGQCPLIDNGAVILAPGGKDALLMAVDCETGNVRWKTANTNNWKMTHSSIMPMEVNGKRTYVYCASLGAVGVDAQDGRLLWEIPDWKISIAMVPSPIVVDGGRIFFTGGYDAGSLMVRVKEAAGQYTIEKLFKLEASVFGATQHTPVLLDNHLYGVRADGQFVCLDLDGKVIWSSSPTQKYGLGPFLLAGGMFYVFSETGKLSLVEATPEKFNLLAQAQIIKGQEAWAPMALAGGRLVLRDLTHMVCVQVGQ